VLPERRAVLFDLDDTLYPYRRFRMSGFVAVADWLTDRYGADRRATLRILARAARGPARGQEVQVALAALQLPASLTSPLVSLVLEHEPRLRLPAPSLAVLRTLRRDGWRLGIVTNGAPAVQARKVAALGLDRHVNTIVYAAEWGSGRGKPDPEPFLEAAERLRVAPAHAVVVGDSDECDVAGATGAGMRAVKCTAWIDRRAVVRRSVPVAHRLSLVPGLARTLLTEVARRHVA
jgi:putative hydrolase of the HAD superfamily